VPDDAYERGVSAGEIAQRLRDHDQHFAKINGSMDSVAKELRGLTLAVQRLGDAADADRLTVKTTAEALEKQERQRREQSDSRWSPMAKTIAVIVAIATVAGAVAALIYELR
jgi:hypothetical protein